MKSKNGRMAALCWAMVITNALQSLSEKFSGEKNGNGAETRPSYPRLASQY